MPYTHCSACGAKALVGATRCPRCQVPFVSYEPNGERVPTVNCPNCGVQRPVAIGVCPNCMASTSPSGARLTRALVMVGIAVAAITAVGYLISRRVDPTESAPPPTASTGSVPAADTNMTPDSTAMAAPDTAQPAAQPTALPATQQAALPAVSNPVTKVAAPVAARVMPPAAPAPARTVPIDPAMVPPKPAPPPQVAVSDSGTWEYAVATTWVRVRSAPTRDSDVLRMVDSAQRVRLGPPQNGWRPVRVGVDRGWVDPRLFTVVPAPRP